MPTFIQRHRIATIGALAAGALATGALAITMALPAQANNDRAEPAQTASSEQLNRATPVTPEKQPADGAIIADHTPGGTQVTNDNPGGLQFSDAPNPATPTTGEEPKTTEYDSKIAKQNEDGTITVEYYKDGRLLKTETNPTGIGFENR